MSEREIDKITITYKNGDTVWVNDINLIEEYAKIQQENQQLKDKIKVYENPDDMTGIFKNCTELNVNLSSTKEMKIDLYKEVIEEVRERLEYYLIGNMKYEDSQKEFEKLLQILDKAKVGDK